MCETTTIQQILADIRENGKAGKWTSCTYRINTDKGVYTLGVKAFGKWCQRLELVDMRSDIAGQNTWKAFDSAFIAEVDRMVRCL